jgi:outer membrane immunogenic protein
MLRKILCRSVASVGLLGALMLASGSAVLAQGKDRPATWSGFYIGGHGGYAWADMEFPLKGPYVPPPLPGSNGPPRQHPEGGFVGGQIGYNHQFQHLVLGVEADISKGHLNSSARDGNYIMQTDTIDVFGTVRGRAGLAFGSFLPYVTAGLIWDTATRGQECPQPAAVVSGHCNAANGFAPYHLGQSKTHTGFVWGGGVEMALTRHFSFKVEGLVAGLGKETYTLGPTPSGKTLPAEVIEHDLAMVRMGFNARF